MILKTFSPIFKDLIILQNSKKLVTESPKWEKWRRNFLNKQSRFMIFFMTFWALSENHDF